MATKLPKTPEEALRFDPWQAAEEVTGKSYKDDEQTNKMGTALHLASVRNTIQIMTAAGDSHPGMKAIKFQHVIQTNGFELIGSELVESEGCWLYWNAYWRTPGQLLLCEYLHWKGKVLGGAMALNNATCYYNWRPYDDVVKSGELYHFVSGGYCHRENEDDPDISRPLLWIGDHDACTGIITALNRMDACGDFIEPWVESTHLWAVVGSLECPPQVDNGCVYDDITLDRLRKQLPSRILDLIAFDQYEASCKARKDRLSNM